ncbi:MAG: outer membrane beta-barrel protein [Paludibacteraceae bacterium]|nr:outer membrane beta-barrel protein [Paludibacteraceae bacterium]
MKKVMLLVLGFLLGLNIIAQNEKPFYLGLYASPSVLWLQSDNNTVDASGSKLGFSYGLLADITLGDYYALASGLEITQLGGTLSYQTELAPVQQTVDYKLQYLEIPLALKMQTASINNLSFFGRFGGGFGVRLDAKKDVNNTIINQPASDEIHLLRAYFSVGGGVEYTVAYNTKIFAGIFYKNGLTNAFKQEDGSVKSNALSLNVGVIF